MRYEEFVNIQLGKLKKAGLIDPDSIPDIDLYIDQVETYFKNQTKDIDSETVKRFLTKTMINNYAKHNMIPHPDGKKYTADHIMMIAMVGYLKGMFKMEEIEYLMKPLVDNYNSDFDDSIDPGVIYRTACETNVDFAEHMSEEIDNNMTTIKKIFQNNELDDGRLEAFTLILSLAMRADMEKYIAERLVEKYFIEPANEKPVKTQKQPKQEKLKRIK